jgi:arylsulfatase A-like enzyme
MLLITRQGQIMKALVIVANGFHLGYLGCYGNDWIATPALDCLAAEGIVFDQHYSDRPEARGARQTWRTGKYLFPEMNPGTHGPPLATDAPDLLQLLRTNKITTSAVINSKESKEFAQGWNHVYELPTRHLEGKGLPQTVETTLAAVDELAHQENWLLWVEMPTLLPPWNVPEQYLQQYFAQESEEEGTDSQSLDPLTDPAIGFVDENDDATLMRLQRTYAAAVGYLDSGLEELFEELQARNLMDKVLLVVTADRGFPLGEHGIVGYHRPWLYDELIHIPLLVRLPGAAEAGRRTSALTQPEDLMPTLLEAFGSPIPSVHGFSLLPLMRGEKDCLRSYACSGLQIGGGGELALRTSEWAFVLPWQTSLAGPPRTAQLYVKPDDRWEVNNVLQHHMDLADNLERVLRGFVEATRRPDPLQAPELKAQGFPQSNPETRGTES